MCDFIKCCSYKCDKILKNVKKSLLIFAVDTCRMQNPAYANQAAAFEPLISYFLVVFEVFMCFLLIYQLFQSVY